MVYDDHARKLGVKAIAVVESNITFDDIYYQDAITVGVAQWYAGKARNILYRMRTENPGSWVIGSTLAQLNTDITVRDDAMNTNWNWWTQRYLTRAEGEALRPILIANQAIQLDQFYKDFDDLVDIATQLGMDKNNNTLAVLFYASMEWQGPRYARQVLTRAGPNASLDRMHAECLNHSVFSRYRSRYNTVRSILLSGDASGIDGPPVPGPELEPGGNSGATRPRGAIKYLTAWGDQAVLYGFDGSKTFARPTGGGFYVTSQDPLSGENPVLPPENVDPSVPPSADIITKENGIRNFLGSLVGDFAYSQGPGRLTPDTSGYSDCSALLHWAFNKVLGIVIGTWTGNQYQNGRNIAAGSGPLPTGIMRVGDLIFFDWVGNGYTAAFDHVEMYYGSSQMIGHGGPGNGPTIKGLGGATTALRWRVQRVIT